ncbi:MAG: type II and III secretion system protein, partial [Verrucomicrobiae bacterium]|nr:type II and III secretion system protein [Verrucomicrobiae bacterium]
KAAIDLLPDAPITKDRRDAYVKQYASASVKLAQQRADEADYEQSRTLLENVLAPDIDPDNFEAKKLLERLNDPDWYSPALTPKHLESVRAVEKALKTAQGYIDIGDYDNAEMEYFKVLNEDRYNSGARRGLEGVEQERLNYYETARNHTRSEFMRRVAQGWELPVPVSVTGAGLPSEFKADTSTDRIAEIENKLKTIIIPSVEFVQTPLRDAIDFLRLRAQELDTNPDVTKRGVDIILNTGNSLGGVAAPAAGAAPAPGGAALGFDGAAAGPPAGGGGFGGGVDQTPITLQLSNVPLVEALRYTLALANLKYKVEPNAVVVLPLSTPDQELYTNVYVVPPNFLVSDGGGGGGGAAAGPVDPFAAPGNAGAATPQVRKTARDVLESYGIVFGQGASATFNPQTSQLIVRQTQDQMELVEAVIESIRGGGQKQIFITSKFIEIGEEVGKELGFDWLLGPFNIGSAPKIFGGGGTTGNTGAIDNSNFSFVQPGAAAPVGTNPLTAGLRSGFNAIDGNSIDSLISEAAGNVQGGNAVAPAIFGIAGVFTDPQFQVMIRALNQHKGVDLMSAPSVLARSGQRAKIEVIREIIYPTEYDPPEIPNQIGGGISVGGGAGGGATSGFPVTPATPAAFETRNTGITLEVDPVIGGDNFTIDLNLAPEVVEFEGFINYGSPINSVGIDPVTGGSSTVQLTENRIEMPIFSTRKVTTQVTIWDGQTVALGGLIREDVQDVQDKVPLLGDMPVVGRLFRNDVELHLKKNLTIFVSAKLVDPAGMPFKSATGTSVN